MAHSLAWLRSTSWRRRAVDAVELLAREGSALAIGVALLTLLIAGSSFLTGLAALDGSVETAWIVLGGTLLVVAVGAPLLAWWRLRRVRRHATGLVAEVQRLASRSPEAERIVIDTVAVEPGATGTDGAGGRRSDRPVQPAAHDRHRRRRPARAARRTARRDDVPRLLGIALLLCLVFAILGFLFLVAWAL